ncbi:MAG TPA: glycoside hydrolase family 140 protein [Puia sp.]|jgi:hypothetical protein
MRSLSLALFLLLISLNAPIQTAWQHGRIRVTADGHYLEYEDGMPFFWLGDTGWELFHKLKREEITAYLQNRKDKGFNVIQAVILSQTPNQYGDRSMSGNDPLKLVERYFELVDWVVQQAMQRGMVMALLPTWGDKVTAIRSKEPALFNETNAYAYGLFLGRRYAAYPNVVWIAGGDNPAFVDSADWRPVFRAMIRGLREGSSGKQLITYHPWGENSSTLYWHGENTLDFNMMQTGHKKHDITGWDWVKRDRAYLPARPVLDGEPNYEDHPVDWDKKNGYFRDYDVRKQLYRSVFAGACGVTYGHHAIWQFYNAGDQHAFAYPDRDWKEGLDRPGAFQAGYLKKLMLSIPTNGRVPDQSMIVGGQGEGGEFMTAFHGADSSYGMVYLPVGKTIILNTAWLKGRHIAVAWFDPARGRVEKAMEVGKTPTLSFTPPTTGAGKDWVLILRNEAGTLRLSHGNPHYLQYAGKPLVLITSGEHYGALMNLDFDYITYLNALHRQGMNNSRVFSGAYVERKQDIGFMQYKNTLAPRPNRLVVPWRRSRIPGYANGGNKFDLDQWDPRYFARLKDLVGQAKVRGIMIELVLFGNQYNDVTWSYSPLYAGNNIQGIGKGRFLGFQSLADAGLVARQEAMVVKIVREMNDFDNLYYEVSNEPYNEVKDSAAVDAWDEHMAELIKRTEASLPKKHLVASNQAVVESRFVDIANYHYVHISHIPDFDSLLRLNKVISMDETMGPLHDADVNDVRVEAWDFLLHGGGAYDNLNWEYTPSRPGGTPGADTIRQYLKFLQRFISGFNFLRMRYAGELVRQPPDKAIVRVLAEKGMQYAVYIHHSKPSDAVPGADQFISKYEAETGTFRDTVRLSLQEGVYQMHWYDPLTGSLGAATEIRQEKDGVYTFFTPLYRTDVALELVRK